MELDEEDEYWCREAIVDLGAFGLDELRKLRGWLIDEKVPHGLLAHLKEWYWSARPKVPEGITFRPAPSLIVRSELEVFGNAMPRWALRAYLGDGNESFINTRRIATICAQVHAWGKRDPNGRCLQYIEERSDHRSPAWAIRTASCIADALLVPPAHVNKDYHVLTEDRLGHAYGEGKLIRGTPFVRHVRLAGGGLCAQAVCFMAAALLSEREAGVRVHGIAEVTALASDDDIDELKLLGLTYSGIARYFRRKEVGLNAIRQIARLPSGDIRRFTGGRNAAPFETGLIDSVAYDAALRSYLLSGIPIVLPLDLGRMKGHGGDCPLRSESIFLRNKQPLVGKPRLDKRPNRHAVLLVGCHRADQQEFLLNDPASMPFLRASTTQLREAGVYRVRRKQPGEAPGHDQREMNEVVKNMFIPVTPRRVRMPLCRWFDSGDDFDEEEQTYNGLMWLADVAQYKIPRPDLPPLRDPDEPSGIFRLAKLNELLQLEDWPDGSLAALKHLIADLKSAGADGGQWVWAQVLGHRDAIWLWNAEADLPKVKANDLPRNSRFATLFSELAVAILERANGVWNCKRCQKLASREALPPPKVLPNLGTIHSSLISSFRPRGLASALAHWPKGPECWPNAQTPACDLYAFLQGEADVLLPPTLPAESALEFYREARWLNFVRLLSPVKLSANLRAGSIAEAWRFLDGKPWRERVAKILRYFWPPVYFEFQGARCLGVRRPVCTVLDRLRALVDDKVRIAEVARNIDCLFSKCPVSINVVAFASFLQEVASGEETRYMPAQEALRAMLQIACALRELNPKRYPISTFEMVGGSLIDGVWPGHDTIEDSDVYVANRRRTADAQWTLLENLTPIMAEAKMCGLRLAIELEPGPLYLLRDWTSLQMFCDLLDSKDFKDHTTQTGINLDVAHWHLASIPRDEVLEKKAVFRRIAHGHISGVGRGHFGDVEIGCLTPIKTIKTWIDLLRFRALFSDPFSPSMFVAVEYEAVKTPSMVEDSLKELAKLL